LLKQFPEQMLGNLVHRFQRFPLLLKFLDVHEMLSVQLHPTEANINLLPAGAGSSLMVLALLGCLAARAGGAGVMVGALRVTF
jgi:mannose-6-phosphate isomerase